MARLYINSTLEKAIKSYCELNEIEDINAFANRCALQGFNIIKFGMSPKDNIERENNGMKDVKKNATSRKKKDTTSKDEGKQIEEKGNLEEQQEESLPRKEESKQVTVRKIQIIKKK